MNCTIIDHRTVCTSNFLDDTSMVTYSGNHTAQERRDIAKCNNAKSNGTECDYSAHGGR